MEENNSKLPTSTSLPVEKNLSPESIVTEIKPITVISMNEKFQHQKKFNWIDRLRKQY